jgi:hypothetical protein
MNKTYFHLPKLEKNHSVLTFTKLNLDISKLFSKIEIEDSLPLKININCSYLFHYSDQKEQHSITLQQVLLLLAYLAQSK